MQTQEPQPPEKGYFRRKIVLPILTVLKQGVTPKKIALSIAFGVTLGIFPVVGATTLLCLITALLLRLNLIIIQAFNWFVYPVQILLLVPFFKLGDYLFRSELLTLTSKELFAMFQTNFYETMCLLWRSIIHAVIVWVVIAPVLVVGLYILFVPITRKMAQREKGK